jgi:hypothetical protein
MHVQYPNARLVSLECMRTNGQWSTISFHMLSQVRTPNRAQTRMVYSRNDNWQANFTGKVERSFGYHQMAGSLGVVSEI